MRQTTYALFVNSLHALASAPPTGETDGPALIELLAEAQEPTMIGHFRLMKSGNELAGSTKEGNPLESVEALAKILARIIVAAAPSIGESASE